MALVLLGACVAPGRAMMVRDDGNLSAYPGDFHACKANADRVFDPANPFLAPMRYDTIGSLPDGEGLHLPAARALN